MKINVKSVIVVTTNQKELINSTEEDTPSPTEEARRWRPRVAVWTVSREVVERRRMERGVERREGGSGGEPRVVRVKGEGGDLRSAREDFVGVLGMGVLGGGFRPPMSTI